MITKEADIPEYFRVYANVDLDQICENVQNMKNSIKPETKMLAVIKADGYGHGAIPIAEALDGLADWFATATIQEALNLRHHGIKQPILVLGYTPACSYPQMIQEEIRTAVYSYEMAKAISDAAVACSRQAYIHIKVDTGMGRIGFYPDEESADVVAAIAKLPKLCIEGIFTHFAKADEIDKSHADGQYASFCHFLDLLSKRHVKPAIRHCANSAAILDMPEKQMDMVRAGISLYGLRPSETEDLSKQKLLPALSLYSHVIHVKEVKSGMGISYGSTFVADKTMRVATIPVGYADGYPRSLSNRGYVLIHGQKAPILGRVCMDQMMVDVTEIAGVQVGTKVTLIGTDNNETIYADLLGELSDRFNYELVCDLAKRVPRVYYKNGVFWGTKDYFIDEYK